MLSKDVLDEEWGFRMEAKSDGTFRVSRFPRGCSDAELEELSDTTQLPPHVRRNFAEFVRQSKLR